MSLMVVTFLLIMEAASSYGGKVLVIHPFYGGSHLFTLRTLSEAMVDKGHEVVIIRWLDKNYYPPITKAGINEIVLSVNNTDGGIPLVSQEERGRFNLPVNHIWKVGLTLRMFSYDGFFTVAAYCKRLLENEVLYEHLRKHKFDVAIVDTIFNDGGYALAYKLGLPAVGFWGFNLVSGFSFYTTAFNPPSSLPQTFSHLTDSMTFMERVVNTIMFLAINSLMQIQYMVTSNVISSYVPDCPHPSQLSANLSGMLINSHAAVDYPRLLPPSFIEVAGMHIRDPKPLPKDLESFMQSSGDYGVIVFSLGFNFDTKHIPRAIFEAYFRAFGRLKQKVIVKAVGYPSYHSDNVKIMPYIPQSDILAHNKTVLFVSHCGMHGVMEAIKYRVPIVGIPIFMDQKDNLIRLEQHGVAYGMDKSASEEQIYNSIIKVLTDSRYKANMGELSEKVEAFGPTLPKAVWLLEYIMKTKGGEHLKLASRNLSIFQYLGLDVFFFLLFSLLLLIYCFVKMIVKISRSFKEPKKIKTS